MLGSVYPHRDIYKSGKTKLPHTVSMYATRRVRAVYNFAVVLGVLSLGIAFISVITYFIPVISSELKYATRNKSDVVTVKDVDKEALIREQIAEGIEGAKLTEAIQAEAVSYGVDSHFSVVIPKIEAYARVVANVDAADEAGYRDALSQGIAHAAGTNFPGSGEGIFLFSHSTDYPYNVARYNAVFYLLRKLERDDEIVVYFADEKHVYRVKDKVVVGAEDVSWLTRDYDKETLILQTCDPPGTTWKRLLVVAEPLQI